MGIWELKSNAVSLNYVLTQNQNSTSDPKDIESIFDTISYKKGASIIHMLEKLVGEQTIRSGLSRYHSYITWAYF